MSNIEKIKIKCYTVLKFSGFLVRRELCSLIVDSFSKDGITLSDNKVFDDYMKSICTSLEKQCLSEKSIEREQVEEAIEDCVRSKYNQNEIIFNIINAFDFPKLVYDIDRKLYKLTTCKPKLLSNSNTKAQLFIDRYSAVFQRTQRNFKNKVYQNEQDRLSIKTVDYLLTTSSITLDKILVLGLLVQVSEGKYYLEDPAGMIELNLIHARYYSGLVVENCFILVNGYYEDKILHVSSVILPPAEEYKESKPIFGNLNYFGGPSLTPLRESVHLYEQLHKSQSILFFSDVCLSHPMIFEKLQTLFEGIQYDPPVAFVFMGNFVEETQGLEKIHSLKKLFKQLGELINNYSDLVTNSKFVFVPGMIDPCILHIVPRQPLPTYITEDFSKKVPNAIFATNPCRLQYYSKEITIFRANVITKLMQGTLFKSDKCDNLEYAVKTIINQGHLSPLSLNALTVHWDFDYTLHLYPLPNLIVLGDKTSEFQRSYKGCQVMNPGSFCDNGFQFKEYIPNEDFIRDCVL